MKNDVFRDLGFDQGQAAELHLRYDLMEALLNTVKTHGYTQKELVKLLGQKQPHVSLLLKGKISEFSSDRLAAFLERLGVQIRIEYDMPIKRRA